MKVEPSQFWRLTDFLKGVGLILAKKPMLSDAKMPSLKDKIEAQAKEAEVAAVPVKKKATKKKK